MFHRRDAEGAEKNKKEITAKAQGTQRHDMRFVQIWPGQARVCRDPALQDLYSVRHVCVGLQPAA
jgi:hypothetical protein